MKVLILWCCAMMAAPLLTAQEDVLRPNGRTQTSVGAQSGIASASASSGHSGVFALGLEAGLGVNFFSQNLPNVLNGNAEQYRAVNGSANGLGGYIAGILDYGISDNIGLQLRLGYQSGSFSNEGDIDSIIGTYQATQQLVSTKQNWDWKVTNVSYFTTGLNVRVNATPELSFTFGPILQVLVGQTPEISLSQTIISPDFMYFVQGTELVKTVTNSAEFTGFTKTRLGLDIAASYKVNLSHSWALLPRMGFQYILTKMAENGTTQDQNGNQILVAENRALNTLQFGVGLLYYFH